MSRSALDSSSAKCWVPVNVLMSLGFHFRQEISRLSERLSIYQQRCKTLQLHLTRQSHLQQRNLNIKADRLLNFKLKTILSLTLSLNHSTSNKLYKFLPELLVSNPLQQLCAIDGDWNDDDLGVNQRTARGDSLEPLRSTATRPHSASGTVNRHVDK